MQRLESNTLPEDFLDAIRGTGDAMCDALGSFQSSRAVAWGERSPVQPLCKCVFHLISCIVRTVEEDVSVGQDNMELSPKEVKNWAKANLSSMRK